MKSYGLSKLFLIHFNSNRNSFVKTMIIGVHNHILMQHHLKITLTSFSEPFNGLYELNQMNTA